MNKLLEIMMLIGARGGDNDDKLVQITHNVTRRYVLAGKITVAEANKIKEYIHGSN